MKKAVILLSGGLDSATVLAIAKKRKFDCYALTVDYNQKHGIEINSAKKIANDLGVKNHKIIKLDLTTFGGSSLTDNKISVSTQKTAGIPTSYVPARNTIFLSLALAWAEVIKSLDIFIGVNAIDYSGYPDCRPEYINLFEKLSNIATKYSTEGAKINLNAPLINLAKYEIIKVANDENVNLANTISCYQPTLDNKSCGICDACRIRKEGFKKSGISDPTIYIK